MLLILKPRNKQPYSPALHSPVSIHPPRRHKEKIHFQDDKGKDYLFLFTLTQKVGKSSPQRNGVCDLQEGKRKPLHLCFNKIENFKLEILNAEELR